MNKISKSDPTIIYVLGRTKFNDGVLINVRDDETNEENSFSPSSVVSSGDFRQVTFSMADMLRENAIFSYNITADGEEVYRGTLYCTDDDSYTHSLWNDDDITETNNSLADREYKAM